MKNITALLVSIVSLAGTLASHAEDASKKCFELCVYGDWILDFDGSSYNVGDKLQLDFSIGGTFKFDLGGTNQEFTVTDSFSQSFTLADNGHNSATGIDDNTPDGRVDPLWIMGSFSACQTVQLPGNATLVDTWRYGVINASINGNPVAGPAFSFGTNIDASHTFQGPPVFTVKEVNCVPETSTSLLGLAGAALLFRRRR